MKIFFDTEFLEDGKTIDLISIGMVREDGKELYLGNREADWNRIYAEPWLMANVVPKLPRMGDSAFWRTRKEIASAVEKFTWDANCLTVRPEFWAYFADYDWVVLCQLFGRMIDLPKAWPQYCRDLKQHADERGLPIRKLAHNEAHSALADARWLHGEFQRLTEAA